MTELQELEEEFNQVKFFHTGVFCNEEFDFRHRKTI